MSISLFLAAAAAAFSWNIVAVPSPGLDQIKTTNLLNNSELILLLYFNVRVYDDSGVELRIHFIEPDQSYTVYT